MHVLHLIKTSEGAIWAYELMRDMKEKHPEIRFSVVLPSGGRHYEEYFSVCEQVFDLSFEVNAKIFARGKELIRIVRQVKPDIIHSWFAQTTLYARLFLRKIKVPRLFEVVGPLHLETYIYRNFDILSAQKIDYWKATSKYTFNMYLNHGVKDDKLFLNYIGVDVSKFIQDKENSPFFDVRKLFNLPDGIKIIGTASYMYPPKLFAKRGVKNHEMLFKVFKELLKRRDDVVLIIGGSTLGSDKKYEHKLREQAKRISMDRIIFTGFVQNLGRLITEFDVFVFLSISENLGGVFESLLFEVPTVASDRGGIPELVINEETGFTCNLDSVNEIADKIEILLENKDLASQFKLKGQLKVFDVFDKTQSLKYSYEIYKSLIGKSN